jgi:hypothetical protein
MATNAIVQFNIDPDLYNNKIKSTTINKTHNDIFYYSNKSFISYCNKYGIDYILITDPKIKYEHPTWERLDLWFDDFWFNSYENICYVDTDVFAMPWASNIFSECNDSKAFHRIPYEKANNPVQKDSIFYSCNQNRVRECIFQAGVILLNKNVIDKTKDTVKRYKEEIFTDDSVLLNYALIDSDLEIVNIARNFNVKYLPNINLQAVQFLHAFGRYKDNNPIAFNKILKEVYG